MGSQGRAGAVELTDRGLAREDVVAVAVTALLDPSPTTTRSPLMGLSFAGRDK
jgi:hypothetical protein